MNNRMKRHNVMTVHDMEIIAELMDAHMSGAKISRITGRSESGTQKYMVMINQIREGKPISCHPSSFNLDCVKAFAKKHGYPEPKNVHPVVMAEQKQPEQTTLEMVIENKELTEKFHGLANDINFLSIRLHEIAEYIVEHFAKDGAEK